MLVGQFSGSEDYFFYSMIDLSHNFFEYKNLKTIKIVTVIGFRLSAFTPCQISTVFKTIHFPMDFGLTKQLTFVSIKSSPKQYQMVRRRNVKTAQFLIQLKVIVQNRQRYTIRLMLSN